MDAAGLEPASPNVLIHSSREVFYRDITTRPIVSIGLEPILRVYEARVLTYYTNSHYKLDVPTRT